MRGDANLISERVIVKIASDSKSLGKEKTGYLTSDAIENGRETAFRIQKIWNGFLNKSTFVTGKYAKILFELEKYEGHSGKLADLKTLIEDNLNENYSITVFRKMLAKYKELGLIDYSSSSPLEIKDSLKDIFSYIDNLSQDKVEALSILESRLKEGHKDIQKGPSKKELEKKATSTEIKFTEQKKRNLKDIHVGHKDIQKGPSKRDLKRYRKDRKKRIREADISKRLPQNNMVKFN